MAEAAGPWGNAGDVAVALLPIAFIVWLTLKHNAPPPTTSLPLSALLAWVMRLVYFGSEVNSVNAAALSQALGALTIVSIIFGAVVLFQTPV